MASIDVPISWERAAEEIIRADLHKVLVIGSSDSGKSTWCRFFCQYLAAKGKGVAMIDADVGQKDIGPPACITRGLPGTGGTAVSSADGYYFVGGVNPFGRFLPIVVGTRRLTDSAEAVFKIIDTTGLVHGAGRVLKGYKIEALRPHVIVAMRRSTELDLLLSAHKNYRVMSIPVSARANPRTQEERRCARETAFSVYFQSATDFELEIQRLTFQRSRIFNGKPVENSDFIYCEQSAEGLLAVTGRQLPERSGEILIRPGFEENLLCGVADATGNCLGLARVKRINFRKRTIRLISPVRVDRIELIQFGDIYIDDNGKALGSRKPGSF